MSVRYAKAGKTKTKKLTLNVKITVNNGKKEDGKSASAPPAVTEEPSESPAASTPPAVTEEPVLDWEQLVKDGHVSVQEGVIVSCDSNISGLLNIPDGVTTIKDSAFYGCSGLTRITLPESVTTIEANAFKGCSGLTSIQVADDNSKYDSRNNCNAIIETETNKLLLGCKTTNIPESVTTIGANSFFDCSGLTSITLPEGVTTIGEYAFKGIKKVLYNGSAEGSPWGALAVERY